MSMKEKGVFIEGSCSMRISTDALYSSSATLSSGPLTAIKCGKCHNMFIVIRICRVPEESGEHHHVAIQDTKKDISACPYCGKK